MIYVFISWSNRLHTMIIKYFFQNIPAETMDPQAETLIVHHKEIVLALHEILVGQSWGKISKAVGIHIVVILLGETTNPRGMYPLGMQDLVIIMVAEVHQGMYGFSDFMLLNHHITIISRYMACYLIIYLRIFHGRLSVTLLNILCLLFGYIHTFGYIKMN